MDRKSSERFFMVMAIVTFIVVVIGATFAYFTASAKSEMEAVNTTSHFVQIAYNDGRDMQANDLIPSTKEIALFGYHRMKYVMEDEVQTAVYTDNQQCIDDNNRTICSIYSFDVTNLGSIEQYLGAFVTVTSNQFTNLSYVLYNVTNVGEDDTVEEKYNNKIEISSGTFPTTYTSGGSFTGNGLTYIIGAENQVEQTIVPNGTQKYEMVIWLNETGEAQHEQRFIFSGKVTVSLTDEEHVKGYIEKVNDNL